jgi:helix-turn-helix protein
MSAKASGRVWDLDLPHNKRLVLLAMVDHADHEGRNIYPSTDLIAWKTGYSFRQVQRIIDMLIEDGILVVIKEARQQRPATYAFNFKAGTTKQPFDRTARKGQSRQNGTPQSRQNGTPEKSRDDISVHPGMTFQPSRDDTTMSSEPWEPIMNHGGGGSAPADVDPLITLFAQYDITQAEPLARLYHEKWPDVTLDQLTRLCEHLAEPDAGSYAGARLYRKLKAGPYERQQSQRNDPPARRAAAERSSIPQNLKRVSSASWKKSDAGD